MNEQPKNNLGATLHRAGLCKPEMRDAVCHCGTAFTQVKLYRNWNPDECEKCREATYRAHEARKQADREERDLVARFNELDVPLLYTDVTLGNFEPHGNEEDKKHQGRSLQLARRFLADWPDRQKLSVGFPQVVIMRGTTGSGKGHIAWSIAKTLVAEHGARARFGKCSDLIRELRDSWHAADGPSESERLRRIRELDLLVIDEVSGHALYGEPSRHLYDLIDHRQERLRPTIVTTNETAEGIAALLGDALVSRAAGWGGMWSFGNHDFRPEARKLRMESAA